MKFKKKLKFLNSWKFLTVLRLSSVTGFAVWILVSLSLFRSVNRVMNPLVHLHWIFNSVANLLARYSIVLLTTGRFESIRLHTSWYKKYGNYILFLMKINFNLRNIIRILYEDMTIFANSFVSSPGKGKMRAIGTSLLFLGLFLACILINSYCFFHRTRVERGRLYFRERAWRDRGFSFRKCCSIIVYLTSFSYWVLSLAPSLCLAFCFRLLIAGIIETSDSIFIFLIFFWKLRNFMPKLVWTRWSYQKAVLTLFRAIRTPLGGS